MRKKLSILQFANKPPFPPMDGGAIGMNNVTQGLLDLGNEVKLISINTSKHFVDINTLPKEYRDQTKIELHFVDTEIKIRDAFFNLFGNRSYHIQRFFNTSLANRISEILQNQKFDIIILESIFLIDYLDIIRKNTNAKIILRAPNVEHLIWERLAFEEKNPIKKLYLNILASRLKNTELNSINKFDGLFTVTEKDLNLFKEYCSKIPSTFIPTGLDVTKEKMLGKLELVQKEIPTIFHLGALDWMPNQEGIIWFLSNVWPIVLNKAPEAKIYIAGRRPFKELYAWQNESIIIEGEIEDAGKFIESHDIMIVPLFSGSGMRVKIIEGMMLGKAIISTKIGAEGIEVHPDKDIILAETKEEFANAILELIHDKNKLNSIKENAAINCKINYSNDNLAKKLEDFLFELVD